MLRTTPEDFMRQALIEAEKAYDKDEVPIGAVVVHNNRIIARAHNLTERLNDTTAHAEMQVITATSNLIGGKYLKNCTIYVTLEPCVMCAGGLAWAQLEQLVFGAYDNVRGYSNYSPPLLHKRTKVTGGILEDECSLLIREFFKKKR
ncbi:tRNA(adenine34) deaminase [Balneicella halophila]|uniref:tRNA-specific adenosine deaminase n=1 Tax=Balneicella halophila TaxID=1537566 RepID=A0A7L4URN1_BALHA|nr:nucleoside deaminase [Balneicella halophila]PVX52426.1 tRNA(adenine34) deaminase [Balneicella halophila]